LFNSYNAVGNEDMVSRTAVVEPNSQQRAEMDRINKVKNLHSTKESAIESRPMFQANTEVEYIGSPRQADGTPLNLQSEQTVSLLTGLPIDNSHSNMVPFFGSNTRQNIEKFTNESLLDAYTGKTSSFAHKREVGKFFQETAQDIHGTPIFTNSVNTDRYIPSLYHQNEKPFVDERIAAPIAGTYENNILPTFKSVDELRVASNPKTTYNGRTIMGQLGETRGIQADVEKQRPERFYEKTQDHLFKTPGHVVSSKAAENYADNFRDTSRSEYNVSYYGGASNSDFSASKQRAKLISGGNIPITDALVQEPKRVNFENDYLRNVVGQETSHDYGRSSIKLYETDRATTAQTHLLNAGSVQQGVKTIPRDLPRATHKETTIFANTNTGHVKTRFDKGSAEAYRTGMTDVTPKTTHKETSILNNYRGNFQDRKGMGYLVKKYDAKTTGKEIITNSSQNMLGNANKNTESVSRENYANAEIRDNKESSLLGGRPSGPQTFQIGAGKEAQGDTQLTDNMLLKEQSNSRGHINNNVLQHQVIGNKNLIGVQTKSALDDYTNDRLQPELVIAQHNQNPYSLRKR
jgi:hypothetical protein